MTRSATRNADNVETVPMRESGIGTNTASESRDDAIARRRSSCTAREATRMATTSMTG